MVGTSNQSDPEMAIDPMASTTYKRHATFFAVTVRPAVMTHLFACQ